MRFVAKYVSLTAALVLLTSACAAQPEKQSQDVEIAIARIACGEIKVNRGALFSDTMAYEGDVFSLVESCYLIRHGDEYMLWDTGLSDKYLDAEFNDTAPLSHRLTTTIADQLASAKIAADAITRIGISHFHPDHTGQLRNFPNALLLIGIGDWEIVSEAKSAAGFILARDDFDHWLNGDGSVKTIIRDFDVFGDGRVVVLATPGHTPGHKSLLVHLHDAGPIILSGDAVHRRESFNKELVPLFNSDRADTLASIDRIKQLQLTTKAAVIIQHEPGDVGGIATLPEWSK